MTLWDVSEAAVACRQLGYRSIGEIILFKINDADHIYIYR